ncbi:MULTISPECIES: hypothetical protein [unclassified Desulfovibrio]|uniref:hypothetical protein n=1 Tax=unclassified Desulfovibrio TaxID=2593640 RepID=UPI000F5EDECF|nr:MULTISPECIES: hypothetical protein [unclassified Desulfovibrio]RRD69360.1 hypothetical protein EII24_10475 [Desulfovibrio sp. OH1209_COT-279]RRD86067.1 hypothetical protein EII23_10475 [Desulfovibrio sp. OH1186_COT-070]
MNDGWKCALWFVGGLAVGAVAASRGKLDFRPLAADLVSRGMDVKDALLNKMEALKEDVEDLAAEARLTSDKRKAAQEAPKA